MANEKTERLIADVVREQFARKFNKMCLDAMSFSTATVSDGPTTLDANKMLRDCEQMLRNARRNQITIVVDMGHDGPILQHRTPCDGERIEMSWRQAQELHQHWPLKLRTVNSPEQAEFAPASGVFPEFVPRTLPMPPYDMPPEDLQKSESQ